MSNLLEEQARFPTDALGAGAELFEGAVLNLANALFADPKQMTDLAKAVGAAAGEAEAEVEHFAFAGAQVFHEELERFLAFVVLVERQRLRVWHRFGELEIAIVVEDGVQADGRAGGGLQVVEVLKAAARSRRKFLGAGQVLAAVRQGFGLLLKEAEFLKVVRRKADQVTLAGDRDLQRLANPPGGVGREPGAVADVEAVDRLHEATDGFLQEVRVSEAVVAEPFGDVGREADVRRSEAMFVMDVAIVQTTDGRLFAALWCDVLADELGHGPRFERRSAGAQIREVSDEYPSEFRFAVPETGEQFSLFFWRQQVR